ncbi:Carnitine O-acetyltransferase mitochondrial [Entomortierella chlamydospora]|uniref:Carnitine O-acetyltransferase mitochondrial n=1 Tax=Entomortierella chlamydospora TaxID=101097 RepID=A0A9P6N1N4_9FUNG|nr:Carnitine O-acetyltransferase mitochondrial [Entomortierella chlamydospora]KAG0021818.1 Carnitine O-acetyltransferase mitochondrial [Entomortierella chlamydospora]
MNIASFRSGNNVARLLTSLSRSHLSSQTRPRVFSYSTAAPQVTEKSFQNQHKLPRLPIPSLAETAARYKKSLIPILSESDLARAEKAVDEFVKPGGLGETLQNRLHDMDRTEKNSWLETIWLNKGYLEWREPSMINVNWWSQFRDSPTFNLEQAPARGVISDVQIQRAANYTSSLLNFNDLVNTQTLPPEYQRTTPLCMNQYKNQFGAYRVADLPRDRIVTTWPTTANYVAVMMRDQIFKVPVSGPNGERVSIKAIEQQLKNVVEAVNNMPQSEKQEPIGVLTSENRDTWAKARHGLLGLSPLNHASLSVIDNALFVICLDDYSSDRDIDISHHNIFHAGDAHNRWFDKSMQFIFENNGRAGINGEHTPADAVIPGRILDEIVKSEKNAEPKQVSDTQLATIEHIKFVVNDEIKDTIKKAEVNAKKFIENVDSCLIHFNEYGSNWLKSIKCSPDAYVQMVLQLAYYRHYGTWTPTYESASTRLFLGGRTETVRSCSVDSVAFVKGFESKNTDTTEKQRLLQKAIQGHLEYMMAASAGKGVDRHLLGLRSMMQTPEEQKQALIFQDPSYIQSMYFRISSSNMSPGDNFWGGFGPVVPEGYGINYAIGKENIKFSISSLKSCKETNSREFRESILGALRDMKKTMA